MDATAAVKQRCEELGFDLVGITDSSPTPDGIERLEQWLRAGGAGSLDWMEREPKLRGRPRRLLPDCRSVIMLGLNYLQERPPPPPVASGDVGRVARYAWGRDYHNVFRSRLKKLRRFLEEEFGANSRIFVDSGPLLEREFAMRAGLGFVGRNTCLINDDHGSWLLLGACLTTLELEPDEPAVGTCGDCTRCIEACPTDALSLTADEWGVLESDRCISTWTIEWDEAQKANLGAGERAAMRDWVFGCDICQNVCPYNHRDLPSTIQRDFGIWKAGPWITLENLEKMELAGSPLARAGKEGLRTNFRLGGKSQSGPGK